MANRILKAGGIFLLVGICALAPAANAKKPSFITDSDNPLHSTEIFAKFLLGFAFGAFPGGGIGADTPIGGPDWSRYLRLGGVIHGYGLAGFGGIDFDAQLRGQYPFKVGLGYLAVYGILPVGFTLGFFPGGVAPGFNFGIVPGVRWFFTEHWGIFTELGFSFHMTFMGGVSAASPTGVWSLGAAYAF